MKKWITIFGIVVVTLALTAVNCGGNDSGPPEIDESEITDAPAEAGGPDAALVAKGQELYTANACNSCHGDTGLGDGPAGAALNPPPRDFSDTANYKQGASIEEITATLESGVPGTSMVAYAHLSVEDRTALAHFVVSLQ